MIRKAQTSDDDAIRRVNDAAFGQPDESDLVERLRDDGLEILSLVAEVEGDVVGHVLFSRLDVEIDGRPVRAASLAPLAVRPDCQRQGIGSGLVREGLARCRDMGVDVVVVVGHPEYYPRFGFSADRAAGLRAPFHGPAFMAVELCPGALGAGRGAVRFPDAFGLKGAESG